MNKNKLKTLSHVVDNIFLSCKYNNLTINDLSKYSKVPLAKLYLLETTKDIEVLSIQELYQIAIVLNVNIKELFK